MKPKRIKYQIVVTRTDGTQRVLGSYLEWDEATLKFHSLRINSASHNPETIFKDSDWDHLELQRVEVLEG
jgi:hypothetical protein